MEYEITLQGACKQVASMAAAGRASGSTFQGCEPVGENTFYFPTAGHGYYATYVTEMGENLFNLLNRNEWIYTNWNTSCIAGEEDCAALIVLYVSHMLGNKLPEAINVDELERNIERYIGEGTTRELDRAMLADLKVQA